MDIETLKIVISIAALIISVGGLCMPILIFVLGVIKKDMRDVKIDLKQNTESTQSLAVRMATLDTRQESFGTRLEIVAKRTHDLGNDMAVVRHKLGIGGGSSDD